MFNRRRMNAVELSEPNLLRLQRPCRSGPAGIDISLLPFFIVGMLNNPYLDLMDSGRNTLGISHNCSMDMHVSISFISISENGWIDGVFVYANLPATGHGFPLNSKVVAIDNAQRGFGEELVDADGSRIQPAHVHLFIWAIVAHCPNGAHNSSFDQQIAEDMQFGAWCSGANPYIS